MIPKLMRLPEVLAATRDGVTRHYDDIQNGVMVPPLKRDRSSYWIENEIGAVVAARIAGKSDDEIRALVKRLVAARSQILPEFLASRGMPMQPVAAGGP